MALDKYLWYKSLFKGNYIKGANTLEGILAHPADADELTGSQEAMTVIFEPMTYGGRLILPDVFFGGQFCVGKGLRTFVRSKDSSFDAGNTLGSLNTLAEITGNTTVFNMCTGNQYALQALIGSPATMTTLILNTAARANIKGSAAATALMCRNNSVLYPLLDNPAARQHIINEEIFVRDILGHNADGFARLWDRYRFELFNSLGAMRPIVEADFYITQIFTLYTSTLSNYPALCQALAESYNASVLLAGNATWHNVVYANSKAFLRGVATNTTAINRIETQAVPRDALAASIHVKRVRNISVSTEWQRIVVLPRERYWVVASGKRHSELYAAYPNAEQRRRCGNSKSEYI